MLFVMCDVKSKTHREKESPRNLFPMELNESRRVAENNEKWGRRNPPPSFWKTWGKVSFARESCVRNDVNRIEWINRISICRRCFSVNKRQQVKVREVVSYCTYRMYVSYEMQDAKCKMQDARCKYLVWYDTIKRETTNTNTCTSSS